VRHRTVARPVPLREAHAEAKVARQLLPRGQKGARSGCSGCRSRARTGLAISRSSSTTGSGCGTAGGTRGTCDTTGIGTGDATGTGDTSGTGDATGVRSVACREPRRHRAPDRCAVGPRSARGCDLPLNVKARVLVLHTVHKARELVKQPRRGAQEIAGEDCGGRGEKKQKINIKKSKKSKKKNRSKNQKNRSKKKIIEKSKKSIKKSKNDAKKRGSVSTKSVISVKNCRKCLKSVKKCPKSVTGPMSSARVRAPCEYSRRHLRRSPYLFFFIIFILNVVYFERM
jgi:hypothetical protein